MNQAPATVTVDQEITRLNRRMGTTHMPSIRVVIVEDSITQREILRRVIEEDPDMIVVGEAKDGVEAVKLAEKLSPDVLLMDIHMPRLNGIEATAQIMDQCPMPVVIASSTLQKRDIDLAVEALKVGAVAVIDKPKGAVLLHLKDMGPKLRQTLREAALTKVRRVEQLEDLPVQPTANLELRRSEIVGICSSAGGPAALVLALSKIPQPYPLPILLVQHISSGFEAGFAAWLSQKTGQEAAIVSDGQRIAPGIWLAPTDFHIVLRSKTRIALVPRKPGDIHCPGGNPMFESLAKRAGDNATGIVFTGMGDDGATGLLALRNAGGQTIIQDEATSMVWGMPKAAKRAGAAQHEMNLNEIAAALTRISSPEPVS